MKTIYNSWYEYRSMPEVVERADGTYACVRPSVRGFIAMWFNALLCRWYGHKWLVDADIGHDHGIEYFECTRCGETHRTVYY